MLVAEVVYGRDINCAANVPPTTVKALEQETVMEMVVVSYETLHVPGAADVSKL
jgi:hypothetical protein